MRKLLVLALVLSVVGLANAGLSIAYDAVNGKVVVSDDAPSQSGISVGVAAVQAVDISAAVLTYRTGAAPLAPAAIPAFLGYTAAELVGYGITGYAGGTFQLNWSDVITSEDPLDWNPAGMWFSFNLSGYSLGTEASHTLRLDLTDLDVQALGGEGQSLFLTPEPMTMLLLGLGGLFLRKKK